LRSDAYFAPCMQQSGLSTAHPAALNSPDVGMEATGVYWQPIHAALEDAFTVVVGNASHMRSVLLRPPCGRLLRSRIARGDGARRT